MPGPGEENMTAAQRLIAEALAAHGADIRREKGLPPADDQDEDSGAGNAASGGGAAADGGAEAAADAASSSKKRSHSEVAAASSSAPKSRRTIEFELRKVNPHIVCKLCAGYFINATTIMECLHTFCRSCIVKYFRHNKTCPTCSIVVHGTNPYEMLRPDRTIQSIVYKLVKDLQKEEEARVDEFYKAKGIPRPDAVHTSKKPESAQAQKEAAPAPRRNIYEGDDQISFVLELDDGSHTASTALVDSSVSNKVTSLEKPYIRTSSKATIQHLKKFLAKKLQLPGADDVDVLCRGEVMGKEFTLHFISKTRWRTSDQLVLKYRPKVEFRG